MNKKVIGDHCVCSDGTTFECSKCARAYRMACRNYFSQLSKMDYISMDGKTAKIIVTDNLKETTTAPCAP